MASMTFYIYMAYIYIYMASILRYTNRYRDQPSSVRTVLNAIFWKKNPTYRYDTMYIYYFQKCDISIIEITTLCDTIRYIFNILTEKVGCFRSFFSKNWTEIKWFYCKNIIFNLQIRDPKKRFCVWTENFQFSSRIN